jgi:hypothetical protein
VLGVDVPETSFARRLFYGNVVTRTRGLAGATRLANSPVVAGFTRSPEEASAPCASLWKAAVVEVDGGYRVLRLKASLVEQHLELAVTRIRAALAE